MTRGKKFWLGFSALVVTIALVAIAMLIWMFIFLWFLGLFGIDGMSQQYDHAAWYFHAPNFIVGYGLGITAVNFCPRLYRKLVLDTKD